MIRMLLSIAIQLAASAVGLIVAAVILDGMTLSGWAFFIAVAIFTATAAIINPFIMKMAVKQAQALLGASALITTFIALVVTALLTSGLSIRGADTWLFATLLVWLVTLLAAVFIPIFLVKRGVQHVRSNNNR